jgi:ABC-type uncharacterized transport system permease subunit
MSETPTVADKAAAPPPSSGGTSGDKKPAQPLAYLLTHQSGVVILVALVIALLVGAALIRYQGVSPWYAYETIIREALLVDGGLTRTLQKTAPLVLTGLAVVIPLRVGLFNIGGQGQLIFGAMFGAWVAYAAGGLGFLGAMCGMVAGMVAGAFIGWIAGVLKATRGVHEVITTIMLNYIAAGVTWWLVTGPLQAEGSKTSGIPQTELIPDAARVGAVAGIPIGFVIAPALAIALLVDAVAHDARLQARHRRRTSTPPAMPASTINRIIALSMVFGGGLAGLAGALEVAGVAPVRAGHRRHPRLRRHHHRPAGPRQPARDDPRSVARRHPAHRRRRACSSRRASPPRSSTCCSRSSCSWCPSRCSASGSSAAAPTRSQAAATSWGN